MKIGVIGTFIKDHIIHPDGRETRSYGGIYYALSILTNLFSRHDEICPACWLGEDIYDDIHRIFSTNGNINFSGIRRYAGNNSAVKLIYHDAESRDEILTNILPEVNLDHTRHAGPVDAWLVNFITGYEMNLATFHQFCAEKSCPVFMDFHSLSLDRDKSGLRILRKLPNWKEWIADVDVLQMNEKEAAVLSDSDSTKMNELVRFGVNVIRETKIRILNITLGSQGSILIHRQGAQILHRMLAPENIGEAVDATGCGDAFMAGFLYFYFKKPDPVQAAKFANSIAGLNSTMPGPVGSGRIEDLLKNKEVFFSLK